MEELSVRNSDSGLFDMISSYNENLNDLDDNLTQQK